jgi:hypothetical protein
MCYIFSFATLAIVLGFPAYGIAYIFEFRLDKEEAGGWLPESYSEEEQNSERRTRSLFDSKMR